MIAGIITALANWWRGRGNDRLIFVLVYAIEVVVLAALHGVPNYYALFYGLRGALGLWLFMVFGWGLYFAVFTGRWRQDEKEIGWIDYICLKLVPFVTAEKHETNYIRGFIGMTLRGSYMVILFLMLNPATWWYGLAGLSLGFIYSLNRIGGERQTTLLPDAVIGGLIGALTSISINQL